MSHPVSLSRLSPVGLAILTVLFLLAVVLRAQDKPTPPTLKPTEMQSLKLQVKQKDALLAKQRLEALQSIIQGAQNDYQKALTDLTAEADKVKLEQSWPKDTTFDPNTLAFAPAPPPAPKETKKP